MPRKKVFGLIARPAGMPLQEFHDHYRHPHGTMGLRIATLRDYVQSHEIPTVHLGAAQSRFEAIAELWFDNGADVRDFRKEAVMAAYLNADEANFVDMKATRLFVGEEEVIVSGPGAEGAGGADAEWRLHDRPLSIKLIQFVQAGAGPDRRAGDGAGLARRLSAFRYVECLPTEPVTFGEARPRRPPEFIGACELWWPTLTAFERAVAVDPDAWRRLVERDYVHSVLVQAERFR